MRAMLASGERFGPPHPLLLAARHLVAQAGVTIGAGRATVRIELPTLKTPPKVFVRASMPDADEETAAAFRSVLVRWSQGSILHGSDFIVVVS